MHNRHQSLLILSGVQGDPRRYRAFHLYEQARLANLDCQLSHVIDPAIQEKIKSANIIVIHRAAYDRLIAWIIDELHRKDGILIFDIDDLVFDMEAIKFISSPDFADPVRYALYQENVGRTLKTLEACNFVTTAGEFLMQRVKQLGKVAYIHRNAFSLEMLACSEQAYQVHRNSHERVVIGYASGTPTHDQDFALIKPSLRSVLKRHPEVELFLVGTVSPGKDWGDLEGRIRRIPRQPWRKLPEIQAQFAINLAPLLVNNPFGQSKSEIKYIEAALLRIPTIASPSEAFTHAIRQGDNGFIANNNQEWEEILERLITHPTMQRSIGERAYEDIQQRYHPRVRARELVETLEGLLNQKLLSAHDPHDVDPIHAKSLPPDWDSARLDRDPTLLQWGLYTLRYRNLPTLVKQVWIFFRRLVVPIFPYRATPEKIQ
jgi:glycosyltransferase involved in cell wall biosynthesis